MLALLNKEVEKLKAKAGRESILSDGEKALCNAAAEEIIGIISKKSADVIKHQLSCSQNPYVHRIVTSIDNHGVRQKPHLHND